MVMSEVSVRVLFFGKARELVECDESKVVLPAKIRCCELKNTIFRELFSELSGIEESCILAVDQKYTNNDEELCLTPSSEVAVIPPLSGG